MAGFQTQTVDLGEFDLDGFLKQQRLALQAPKKGKKKGFLLDQVSTGGGIGGALAGGAAGAAAGSVVPILGTAVGGILGALLGGGVGSAGGEIIENKITGDAWDKNVAKEGLIGGATSLPIGAALKLARAGVKAGTGIGKTAAGELVEQAGRSTVPGAFAQAAKTTANSKVGKNLEKLSGQMLNSQTQVTGAQARKMGLRPVETMSKVNQRTGLTNFEDMAEVGKSLTGGNDSILDVLTREAVNSTSGVTTPNIREITSTLIQKSGRGLTPNERKALIADATEAGVRLSGGADGSLGRLSNPGSVLDEANAYRQAASDITNSGLTASVADKSKARIYNGIAKDLEEALYKSPGVNQSIPDLTRYGQTSLREMAGEARVAGNGAQADALLKVADELGGVKNVQQLRKMKKDFVDLGKMDTVTAQADGARQFNAESASSMMKGSPIKGTLAALTNLATPRVAGQLGKAGRAMQQGAPAAAGRANQALLPLVARQGAGRLLTADAPVQDPSLEAMPVEGQFADPSMEAAPEQIQEPSIGGYSKSQLEAAMVAAAQAGDSKAFNQVKELYSMLPEDMGMPKLSSSTAQLAAKQSTGQQALDQLEGAYGAAGGGQGVIGGNLANLAGELNINSAAGAYNDQVSGTARQIARAMGEVGAGSDSDAQAFISRLPRLTDSPERAAQKVAQLRALLQASQRNTLMYGAGAQEQYGANA